MRRLALAIATGAALVAPVLAHDLVTAPTATGPDDPALRALLHLPDGVPLPRIPADNPLTAEKIALGRALFYDTRLSANQTQACASCHLQELAFTDGLARPTGSTGHILPRNAQGLFNLGYLPNYTWASNALVTLEDQIAIPIRAERPVELGVNDGNAAEILARFAEDPDYVGLFTAAWPDSGGEPSWNRIILALASFLRTINSFDSRYDRHLAGEQVLTAQELQGLALFNSERLECFHCHSGPTLTTAYVDAGDPPEANPFVFFSNGLYNVGNAGTYPALDRGLYDLTLNRRHMGLFRPPSLRNVALTAPYMQDGSIATLDAVIDHYAAGGTVTPDGPLAGDGRLIPTKSSFVRGFTITNEERAALIAFLNTLTDETLTTRPDLGPPNPAP
jgi:cytochrome c peroxidase